MNSNGTSNVPLKLDRRTPRCLHLNLLQLKFPFSIYALLGKNRRHGEDGCSHDAFFSDSDLVSEPVSDPPVGGFVHLGKKNKEGNWNRMRKTTYKQEGKRKRKE